MFFDSHTVHINAQTGVVVDEGQVARPGLREMNWLHLNRGKQAWTFFADLFAVMLIFIAISGLFMIKGRKGVAGRGAIYVVAGVAIPVGYLIYSGGP